MNCIDNMKTIYGLTDDAFQIPCNPVINAMVGCKMNLIDWADQMHRELDAIQSGVRKWKLNDDEESLKNLQGYWHRMIEARVALDRVLNPES